MAIQLPSTVATVSALKVALLAVIVSADSELMAMDYIKRPKKRRGAEKSVRGAGCLFEPSWEGGVPILT